MGDFKNEFSWSVSRDAAFRECRRKYYYAYYGYWGGWDRYNSDHVTRTLYVLKQLQNRWLWKGSVVHHEIERVLKELVTTGRLVPFEKSVERVRTMMREGFRYSRDGLYWEHDGSMKNKTALFEHEYEAGTPDEVWKKNYDEVVECLKAFYESPVLEEIKNTPRQNIISIESMNGAHFSFSGDKYFVKLDLAYEKDGGVEIVDWKTGASEADDFQFRLYTLYAAEELEAPHDKISLTEYKLQSGESAVHRFTKDDISAAGEYIKNSIQSMRDCLSDPVENAALMKDFPRTEDEKMCSYCNFKKICFNLD
jgi:CRISPR/Cas system-associated exonuclease Cas4 (RecB family)